MQKDESIKLHKQGFTYQKIGKMFDVSRQRIHQIITGYKSPKKYLKLKLNKIIEKDIIPSSYSELKRQGLEGREYKREQIRIYFNHTCQNIFCNKKWKKGQRRFDVHHLSCSQKDTKKYDAGKLKDIINSVTLLCHKCHKNIPEHIKAMIEASKRY